MFRRICRFFTPLNGLRKRFLLDQRGAVMVFLAIATIPLIGFVGIGTDVARAYLVKSRLSSALDAAGLAGGQSFFLPTRDADIDMFFRANFPDNYMGATVTGPTKIIDEANETIQLHASASVPTSFMHLIGHNSLSVDAAAEVVRNMTALDVVLSIDMSGSMNWSSGSGGSRIEAARSAATELVTILFGDDAQKDFLNIGIVPWAGKVKVMRQGQSYDETLTTNTAVDPFINPITGATQSQVFFANNSPVPLLSTPESTWTGCVFNRYLHDGLTTSDADTLLGPVEVPDADWVAWQPIGFAGDPFPGSGKCYMTIDGAECTRCPYYGISGLNNVKLDILSAIDDLQSPTGTTNIPAGLGWAWRALKPQAPFTEAVADPDYNLQRAIVLLTDGENTGGVGDGYKTVFGMGTAAGPQMNDRLLQLADNIKADGVIIYVIQFANSGGELQQLLKDVASGPQSPYYYYAPDGDALQQVFREIANHLSVLRLAK
jgi:Flp pilus assembly protein TadG